MRGPHHVAKKSTMTTVPLMSEAVTMPFVQPAKLTFGMGLPSSAACSARASGLSSHVQSSGNSLAITGWAEYKATVESRTAPVLHAKLNKDEDFFMRCFYRLDPQNSRLSFRSVPVARSGIQTSK